MRPQLKLAIAVLLNVLLQFTVTDSLTAQQTVPANRRAEPLKENPAPFYPADLRKLAISGRALLRVVVDTNGRVAINARTTILADHRSFDLSLKSAVRRWQFVPAIRAGRPVTDTVEIQATFQMVAGFPTLPIDPIALARTSPAAGRWNLVVGTMGSVADATMPDSMTQRLISLAVLDTLLVDVANGSPQQADRTSCVSVLAHGKQNELTLDELSQLKRSDLAVMNTRRCPKTFASPVVVILTDSLGREIRPVTPPGEDPFGVTVKDLQPFSNSDVVANAQITHGTGGREYRCHVFRDTTRQLGWRAVCVPGSAWHS